jgi:hypothetical protein
VRPWLISLCLVSACSEPLVAVVGVEGKAQFEQEPDAQPGELGSDEDDQAGAASDTDAAMNDHPDQPDGCLPLPDLVQAGVVGEVVGTDARTRGYTANGVNTCPATDADGGVFALYVFERLDKKPIVRGGRRYALRWPPRGEAVTFVGIDGPLSASQAPCEGGEPLRDLSRGINSTDCVELEPDADAAFLRLGTPVLYGWGLIEFELCAGSCTP